LQGLERNGITLKLVWLLSDKPTLPENDPLKSCRKRSVCYFVGLELLGFGATFAITQAIGTLFPISSHIAAIGFPIIILLLIPVRMYIRPRFCTHNELFELDAPVASPFTMEFVGASVVGVQTTTTESPEETSGETDERESSEDEDWRSVMERGDAIKLKRRKSSMIDARTRRESAPLDIRGAVMTGESSHAAL
jgi:boron transporter